MPRPQCCRRISGAPPASVFHPVGASPGNSAGTVLSLDEFEAIRLADLEGLYQAQAAERMNVSRPTFGRILASAHRKVAQALVRGDTLRIEGGTIRMQPGNAGRCACPRCRRLAEGCAGASEPDPPVADSPACGGGRRRRAGFRNL